MTTSRGRAGPAEPVRRPRPATAGRAAPFRTARSGPTRSSDRSSGPSRPTVAARSSQSMTVRIGRHRPGPGATSPRRGWSWVTRHPSGSGTPRSRSRQASRGPTRAASPTVVGLTRPVRRRRPGIQVTVGTWWVEPPRKANGPGGGGSCSSSMIGATLIQPVPRASHLGHLGEEPGVVVGDELELERAGCGSRLEVEDRLGQRLELAHATTPAARAAGPRTWRTRPRGRPRAWPRRPSSPDRDHLLGIDSLAGGCDQRGEPSPASRGPGGIGEGDAEVLGADLAPGTCGRLVDDHPPAATSSGVQVDGSHPSANRPQRSSAAGTMPAGPELERLLERERRPATTSSRSADCAVVGDRLAGPQAAEQRERLVHQRALVARSTPTARDLGPAGQAGHEGDAAAARSESTSRVASSLASRTRLRPGGAWWSRA